jgi:hypothetical protein
MQSGVLSKTNKTVNEQFFLSYNLSGLTDELQSMAPNIFRVFDAFATTRRQLEEMSTDWF